MNRKLIAILIPLFLSLNILSIKFTTGAIQASDSYPIHNLETGLNYTTIQEAINANQTLNGHTIFVDEGVYIENVIVNKSVSLFGENRDTTIINGRQNVEDNFLFSINRTNGAVVEGFTLQNCKIGVFLLASDYCRISNNKMLNCSWFGVWAYGSRNNFVDSNFFATSHFGVYIVGEPTKSSNDNIVLSNIFDNNSEAAIGILQGANNTIISSNLITKNSIGVNELIDACNSLIVANTLQDNGIGLYFYLSDYQTVYHNNFIDNTVDVDDRSNQTIWDNGYHSGGNYWSRYNGTDIFSGVFQNETGSDGIGDIPYEATNYTDVYPLMLPYTMSQNMTIESRDLYYLIFKNLSNLAIDLSNLNAENQNLNSTYETLLSNYTNLQEAIGNLNSTYLATLTKLNDTTNEMYVLVATTVVLAFVASLLAVWRKRK
jgi:parallel beta-helix repeat protein